VSTLESLVVRDIRAVESAKGVTLSAQIQTTGLALPPTVWFQFPPDLAPFIVPNGDPFFPAALLAAMLHGRRLVIESDVSSMLLAAASRIMGNYHEFQVAGEPRFLGIEVVADSVPRTTRGRMAGLFFSCGVDSFYTLLGNVARYPDEDSRAVSHLVLVHGFDIPLEKQSFFETVHDQVDVVARALGKTLVPVRTNVRDLLCDMDWSHHAVGPAIASVGLSLGRLFHTLFIASGAAFGELRRAVTGCHPGLDPLWSTETLEFVHAGTEAKKADKIPVIASSPLALRTLRVCWKNPGGAYNCGRCEKCLSTMVLLDLYGVLDQTGQFPPRLDLGRIAGLDLTVGRFRRTLWFDILARVKANGGRPELVEVIETALTRGAWAASRLGLVDASAGRCFARIGLSPARIKALDQVILGGLVTRLFRAGRRSLSMARVSRRE
jgi:hypothetical protein